MSYKLIDGRLQARALRQDIKARVGVLRELGWSQKLVSIAVGGIEATALYVRNQQRACSDVGIAFEDRSYSSDVTQQEMRAAISALNVDPRVTGIILQRPVPSHLDLKYLQNAIHPDKDVEGMNAANIGNIVYGGSALGPCTARASVVLLKSTGLNLRGLEVVVVGHSEIVGKPIALQLMEEFATVTICHAETRNLAIHTRRAEALFVAVGKPGLITGEMVKPGRRCHRHWHQPGGEPDSGRRGLRERRRRCGVDHAGAGRRRPDDRGDPAEQHGAGGGETAQELRRGDGRERAFVNSVRAWGCHRRRSSAQARARLPVTCRSDGGVDSLGRYGHLDVLHPSGSARLRWR